MQVKVLQKMDDSEFGEGLTRIGKRYKGKNILHCFNYNLENREITDTF